MNIVILLFFIILILFVLFYFIFKVITFKKYIKSGEVKSIIVVVARYNEDLKWIITYPFNNFIYCL